MALGHIRSPEHLLAFFREKGWNHLVLDVVDVAGIDPQLQLSLAEFYIGCQDMPEESRQHDRDALARTGPMAFLGQRAEDGLIVVSFQRLCDGRFSVQELAALQQIVEEYKDRRRGQGRPTVESDCGCGGRRDCRSCAGHGRVVTLVEMSPREAEIARDGR
jgi:hypothetical protein